MTARARWLRITGSALVLAGGLVHLQLLVDDYGTDGIARAFAANAVVAALVGGYLVLRADRLGPIAGVASSVGSLAALVLARIGDGLFGFREQGWNPMPQVGLAVAAEVLALAVLLPLVLGRQAPDAASAPARPPRRRPLVAPGRAGG